MRLAKLWEAGKLIGGDEDEVIFALMDEVERLQLALRPDAEALAAVPNLNDAKAVVLYFPTDHDRDEFVALIQEAKPGMRSVKL